jgi:hypothetical protein
VLGTLLGHDVYNGGVSGNSSTQIAMRQGSYPITATIIGGVIPSSGGVAVSFTPGYEPVTSANASSGVTGSIDGIYGIVTLNGSEYIFTRMKPGAVVSVASAPFVVDTSYHNGGFTIIWAGRNNYSNPAQVESDIANMVASLPSPKRFLVLSVINGNYTNEYVGQSNYNEIASLNAALASTYPQNFLDIRSLLVAQYDPSNPIDVIDQGHDVVPFSERAADLSGTLTTTISSTTQTAFTVSVATSPTGNLVPGNIIRIGSEYIQITASNGNSVTNSIRGYGNTTAGTYAIGSSFTGTEDLHLNAKGYTYVANQVYNWIVTHDSAEINNLVSATDLSNILSAPGIIGSTKPGVGLFSELNGISNPVSETAPLGSELTSSADWNNNGWGGNYSTGFTAPGNSNPLSEGWAPTANLTYQVAFTLSGASTGYVTVSLGGKTSGAFSANGPYSFGPQALSSAPLTFTPSADFNGTISQISVKQVVGTYQPTYAITDSTGSSAGSATFEVRSSPTSFANTFVGGEAGSYNTTGIYDTAIGTNALKSNTTGSSNTALGTSTLYHNTTGIGNVAVGTNSLAFNVDGINNVAVGEYSLGSNTSGNSNVALGQSSLTLNSSGMGNVGIGQYALTSNGVGTYNVAIGLQSLEFNSSGGNNVAVGLNALYNNTTGTNNTALGYDAGTTAGISGLNQTANHGLYLGDNTKASADGNTNEVVIGYNTTGHGSNTVTLGNSNITTTVLQGNIGIGTSSPIAMLDISQADTNLGALFSGTTKGIRIGFDSGTSYLEGVDNTGFSSFQPLDVVGSTLTFSTPGRNARMFIDSSGKVGIGTISPSQKLEVDGESVIRRDDNGTTPTALLIQGAGNANQQMLVGYNTTSDYGSIQAVRQGTAYEPIILNASGGNVGIGTTTPSVALQVGNSSISGSVAEFQNSSGTCSINPTTSTLSCSSDARLKTNITSMSSALQGVLSLNPVTFNWDTENSDAPTHPGFIAQEVQPIFPHVVSTDSNGYLSVGYSEFVPYLVSAIQAQEDEIQKLQNQNGPNATGSISVYVPSNFSGDSVGEAEIQAGSSSVHVTFSQQYADQPIVTATPLEFVEGSYRITYIDVSGFTIETETPVTGDTTFDWHSFASPAEQLTVSNGTTTPVQTIQVPAPAVVSPSSSSDQSQATTPTPSPSSIGTVDPSSNQSEESSTTVDSSNDISPSVNPIETTQNDSAYQSQ